MSKRHMVVTVALAFGCLVYGETGPDERVPHWGPTISNHRFAAMTDKEAYYADEPIKVKMILQNVGTTDSIVLTAPHLAALTFDVRLPDGRPAPQTLEGERQGRVALRLSSSKLAPGQVHDDQIPMLNQLFDMTLAGEYTVTISRNVLLTPDQKERVDIASNTMIIRVSNRMTPSDTDGLSSSGE